MKVHAKPKLEEKKVYQWSGYFSRSHLTMMFRAGRCRRGTHRRDTGTLIVLYLCFSTYSILPTHTLPNTHTHTHTCHTRVHRVETFSGKQEPDKLPDAVSSAIKDKQTPNVSEKKGKFNTKNNF